MASIHRRPKTQYWFAAWRDGTGRLHLRSTKQADRTEALKVALEFERAEKLAGAGVLTENQARDVLADILKRTTGDVLRNPSAEGWLKDWLASKTAKKAAATAERYGHVVAAFLEHLDRGAARPLNTVSPRDVDAFLAKRTKAGCSDTTVNIDGKILRAAFNQARREGVIPANPVDAVELPEKRHVERGTFTAEEVNLLAEAATGEWPALIRIAYYTGARLGDCCRLRWDGIDFMKGTLTYTQSKTGAVVTLPMHPELQSLLERLAKADTREEFILPHMAGLKSGGRHGLSEGFKRIVTKAGLDLQTVQGGGRRKISRRTFHALRHSFTSALANAGVPAEVRMKLTGHTTERAHTGYTHHEMEVLRAAVAKLPTGKT